MNPRKSTTELTKEPSPAKLLRLFVYDHCHYCVRTRVILGLKALPFQLTVLLNDDEASPIAMIGAKVCPILEKADGTFMGESLDIVHYIDHLDHQPIISSATNNAALTAWINENSLLVNQLLFPRWVSVTPPLAEFTTALARDYFTHKKQKMIGDFSQAMANTQQYKLALEAELITLIPLIKSTDSLVEQPLTIDDIDLFSRLRGLTLIKDLVIPAKVRAYIDYFAEKANIPLYDDVAL